jgi:hypothetical protein
MKQPKKSSYTGQNKKYVFVQRAGDDFTSLKLIDKKYNDVIFKYGDVAFAKDEKPDGTLPMRFKYDILMNPNGVDTENQDFINYIGDILVEILEKQLKDGNATFKQ